MDDSDIPYIMPWDEPELSQGKMPERIMKMWEREREKQSRTVDDRESRPCPHCGFMLHYDGWCMVHHDGPQKNRGGTDLPVDRRSRRNAKRARNPNQARKPELSDT